MSKTMSSLMRMGKSFEANMYFIAGFWIFCHLFFVLTLMTAVNSARAGGLVRAAPLFLNEEGALAAAMFASCFCVLGAGTILLVLCTMVALLVGRPRG